MGRKSKYAPKGKKFETFGSDMSCPYCKKKIESPIKKYGVVENQEEGKTKGIFWFEYVCQNCQAKVINYTNLNFNIKKRR